MERITYLDTNDFVQWLISESMGDKAMNIINKNTGADGMDIEFKINGVELPFIETLKEIENQLDNLVESKARELIKEKVEKDFENLLDVYDLGERLKDLLEKKYQKLL